MINIINEDLELSESDDDESDDESDKWQHIK